MHGIQSSLIELSLGVSDQEVCSLCLPQSQSEEEVNHTSISTFFVCIAMWENFYL